MNQAFRLRLAKQSAEDFLRKENIISLPVNPLDIAAKYNIIAQAKPDTEKGVSGMLLRHGNTFGILYATDISSEGFQRFSIAHELGHYFLEGHIDHVLPNNGNIHASYAGFVSGDQYEMEADFFASGLLMPSDLFKRELGKYDSGFASIEAMANKCITSLTATASRYAELTDDAIAIIISTGQTVDYCFLSDKMKSLRELTWIRKGTPVPKSTLTNRFNGNHSKVLGAERAVDEIDVMDWLGGIRSVIVTEEVIGLGVYGKTLTVLSADSLVAHQKGYDTDQEEEDDEEDIIESWTPRFRR